MSIILLHAHFYKIKIKSFWGGKMCDDVIEIILHTSPT